jgi:2'-5' RNA ligase
MYVRCFVAVEVEDSFILDAIGRVQSGLIGTGANLKIVERENIHLTMRFLGDVDVRLLDEVKGLVSAQRFYAFPMELEGVGVFPNLRRPRVVWVGVTKGVEELKMIYKELERAILDMGLRPEKRGFRPHITIARIRSGRNREQLVDEVLRSKEEKFGGFEVKQIILKKSVLTPKGPIYSTLIKSQS